MLRQIGRQSLSNLSSTEGFPWILIIGITGMREVLETLNPKSYSLNQLPSLLDPHKGDLYARASF